MQSVLSRFAARPNSKRHRAIARKPRVGRSRPACSRYRTSSSAFVSRDYGCLVFWRASGARGRAGRRPRLSDRDGWLCPVSVDGDPVAQARANAARRASNKGFLSMGLDDYLRILDWTGRQVRRDKRGAIPNELAPILERLGMSAEFWLDTVTNFGRWFHRAAGRVSLLADEAARADKRWLQGVSHCQQVFA